MPGTIACPPSANGKGGGRLRVKTEAPPVTYKTYINERKGITEKVPDGIDPAFNWNQGKVSRMETAKWKVEQSKQNYEENASKAEKHIF